MANTVSRPTGPRAPWILPALLALIVALIVLGVIFGPRIKNALNSPTATPIVKTVVVTATPTPGTPGPTPTAGPSPTANPAILPSATPASGVGVVTPLPGATPLPTVPGVQIGLISYKQIFVTAVQSKVNAGNAQYQLYLNPRLVVQDDLPHFGFTQGFEIVSPAPSPSPTPYVGTDHRHVVKFVVDYQGKVYTAAVAQPGRQDAKGIWLILSIVPGKT